MKKTLSLIFVLVLQLAISVPALAATSTGDTKNDLPGNDAATKAASDAAIQSAKQCADQNKSNSGITVNCGQNAIQTDPNLDKDSACNGGVKVSSVLGATSNCVGGGSNPNPIFDFLNIIIKTFSGIIGLLLVLSLVEAGIRYIISNGSPEDTKAAKERIKATVTGLLLFVLMVGILQFLLPANVKIFQ